MFNITGGPDLSLFEVNEAAEIIKRKAHPEANIIFGAVIDESLSDELRITLIATGFEAAAQRKPYVTGKRREGVETKTIVFPQPKVREPRPREEQSSREPAYDPEDLEVPTFLRKRIHGSRAS